MRVILFDDNKARPGEIDAFAKEHGWFEVRTEQDPFELEDDLEGATAVFVHNSLGENGGDEDLKETREMLPGLCKDTGIECVRFSGAFMSDNEAYRQMNKENFFRRLPKALRRWEAAGSMDLGLLFHDGPVAEAEAEVPLPGNTARLGADFDTNNVDAYKSLLAGAGRVEIDLDVAGPAKGLISAAMIRLWLPELGEKALCPIIFRGAKEVSEYARTQGRVPWQVLFCDGSYFNPKDGEGASPLRIEHFRSGFLDRVKIRPVEEAGNHTISNDWGAFLVGLFTTGADCGDGLFKRMSTNDPMYLLYIWLSAMSGEDLKRLAEGRFFSSISRPAPHKGKKAGRILLVDDQVDVWGDVMERLLDAYELRAIPRKDFNKDRRQCYISEAAEREIMSGNYDLILLDLRLGGVAEEDLPEGEKFSGLKVMDKIYRMNPGQQVVMFTSSNKAWNLSEALNYPGCAGYYIKESPATGNSLAEVRENVEGLLTTIERGMSRAYLKNVYSNIYELKKKLKALGEADYYSAPYYEEISAQLDIAYTTLYDAAKGEETHADNADTYGPAFLAIEQVIEIMAQIWCPGKDFIADRIIECFDIDTKIGPKCSGNLRRLIWERNGFVHRNDNAVAIDSKEFFERMLSVVSDIIMYAL
ncbi:MAG: hypothetical protein K2M06_01265 [Muribaculaceae bacterium]|nr:hypothetical protein [Muribaculaceae bacterium]